MTYDSRPDTLEHIRIVQRALGRASRALEHRAIRHDQSKLESPEREGFDEFTPKLASLTYGTEEYRTALREMQPFLRHHYEQNSHHPEHHPNGVWGMSLLDVIEMLCDWWAAGQRHAENVGVRRSIEINQERFGYSDELRDILLNTAAELGLT